MKLLRLALPLFLVACQAAPSWKAELERRLPVLGHRNFVVVADSAYPAQSSAGITTLFTDADHLAAIAHVLAAIEAAPHVDPVVYIDAELTDVSEADAAGVEAFRAELAAILGDRAVRVLEHLEIIRKLDDSADLFEVLVLKTRGLLPYTSVFIELDCGYWDAEAEARLRAGR